MRLLALLLCVFLLPTVSAQSNLLVLQSDFGLKDAAVATMKGVAVSVSPQLKIYDATHEIEAFNILEAAYRLKQTAAYWPAGTVFVSIVDPGVGTKRKSIVLKTKSGHYFVTPDNGTITLVADLLGIAEVREIDETVNRLADSQRSYTFHGRDVYVFTGARLAAGVINFEQVGAFLNGEMVLLPISKPSLLKDEIVGEIPVLDAQYGNVWTNIDSDALKKLGIQLGDTLSVKISHKGDVKYQGRHPFVTTFSQVPRGKELLYLNGLLNLSLAINLGNFAATHGVRSGEGWAISVTKVK